jgi:hypothetical protein
MNTKCECPLAGYCNRHGVEKSAHQHKLCQNHTGYFNLWENCKGPGQNPSNCGDGEVDYVPDVIEPDKPLTLPSKMQMAKNLVKATADHVKSGLSNVAESEQERRLAICAECPLLIKESGRCSACGCFLATKTKWASSSCPKGKW